MRQEQAGCISYSIGRRETVSDIMRKFSIGIKELKEYNASCDFFSLREGQTLLIKDSSDFTGRSYTLQQDETIWSVAEKFKVSALSLLKANSHLLPHEIRQGIRISLPD